MTSLTGHKQEHSHQSDPKADSSEHSVCASPQSATTLLPLTHSSPGTTLDYAKAIYDFSKIDSGRGYNFENLAEFLAPRYSPQVRAASTSQDGFIVIYELCLQPSTSMWFQNTRQLRSCEEFCHGKLSGRPGTKKNLVFLRGYPSPEWIRCIGSMYSIDPEYFRRHIDFGPPVRSASRIPTLSLRSSSPKMLTLNITTVQLLEVSARRDTSSERQRSANDAGMEQYIMSLLRGDAATGEPIVRDFWTIDATSFVIEQRISIYLQEHEEHGSDWTCKCDPSPPCAKAPVGGRKS